MLVKVFTFTFMLVNVFTFTYMCVHYLGHLPLPLPGRTNIFLKCKQGSECNIKEAKEKYFKIEQIFCFCAF
jgi:hypothetical protein